MGEELKMSKELAELREKPICAWSPREKLIFIDFVNQANQQGHIPKVEGECCLYCGNLADASVHLGGDEVPELGVIVPSCKQCIYRAELSHICRSRKN